jgi:hypothetical protein
MAMPHCDPTPPLPTPPSHSVALQQQYLDNLKAHQPLPSSTPGGEHPRHLAADNLQCFSVSKIKQEDPNIARATPFPLVNQPPVTQQSHQPTAGIATGQSKAHLFPTTIDKVMKPEAIKAIKSWIKRQQEHIRHCSQGRPSFSNPPTALHMTNQDAFTTPYQGILMEVSPSGQVTATKPPANLQQALQQPMQQEFNAKFYCDSLGDKFPDQEMRAEAVTGITDASDTPLDFLLGPHHSGFMQQLEEALQDLHHDHEEGWLS